MTQCEPMTSYHFTGNEIENSGLPEWGPGYPVEELVIEGGARKTRSKKNIRRTSTKRRTNKKRTNKKRTNKKRTNKKRTRRTTRRMAAASRRRANGVANRNRKSIKYQRSGKRRPGRAISYKQGRVKKTRYGRDARGNNLARQGISPNKKAEKVVRGARNQKRPSASYYYNVLKKPVGTKIYYRPKKSGKEKLHVLAIRNNGVPYWKVK